MAFDIKAMIERVKNGDDPRNVLDESLKAIATVGSKALKSSAVRKTARTAVRLAKNPGVRTAASVAGSVLPGKAGKAARATGAALGAYQGQRSARLSSIKARRTKSNFKKAYHKVAAGAKYAGAALQARSAYKTATDR